jgi:peptidoglycan/xylan/chitin deacetylase (PgdA/CDA1 family)
MKLTKRIARDIVFPTIFTIGADKLLLKSISNKGAIALYHGVAKSDLSWLNGRHLIKEEFEKHIRYIAKNFTVLPVAEVFELYRNGQALSQKKPILGITFDDGFVNNLTEAVPTLTKYNIPATIFAVSLPLTNVDTPLWPDTIEMVQAKVKTEFLFDNLKIVNKSGRWFTQEGVSISDYVKSLPYKTRDLALTALRHQYLDEGYMNTVPTEAYKLLNASQLYDLAQTDLITIGSHSHLHYNLATLSDEDIKTELTISKKLLEEATKKPVDQLAYPDGSYDERVKRIAESVGYKYQMAVDYRLSDDAGDTRVLPRFCISNTTTLESNMLSLIQAFRKYGF